MARTESITRTALTRNGLAELRCAPHGRALKRFSNQKKKRLTYRQLDIKIEVARSRAGLGSSQENRIDRNNSKRNDLKSSERNWRTLRTEEVNNMSIKSYIVDTEGNVQITRHFKVKEFACKDGSPVVFIDDYMVTILDILRNKLGKPIIITSGYRTTARNKEVGGAKYSYHMRGMAADIRVDGMSAKEIANKLNAIVPDECGIIVYKSWVHFDVRTSKYRKGV